MEERMIIGPPKGTKFIYILSLVCSPFFFWLWFLSDIPNSRHNVDFFFMFLVTFITFVYTFIVFHTDYIIDNNGVARVILRKFSQHIQWSEMKYIGACEEPAEGGTSRGGHLTRTVMVFSKISYEDYMKHHSFIGRLLETKLVFAIQYIDDETYEKILEFSGGERNIP